MVTETMVMVQVCAEVREPTLTCPISFPFEVMLSTINDTAGWNIPLSTIDNEQGGLAID